MLEVIGYLIACSILVAFGYAIACLMQVSKKADIQIADSVDRYTNETEKIKQLEAELARANEKISVARQNFEEQKVLIDSLYDSIQAYSKLQDDDFARGRELGFKEGKEHIAKLFAKEMVKDHKKLNIEVEPESFERISKKKITATTALAG